MSNLTKSWWPIIAVLVIVGSALTIFGFQAYYFFRNPSLDYQVSGPVALSPEWLEIKPQKPLQPVRKVQNLIIKLDEPMMTGNPALEPTKEDGTSVTLEAELIDQNGRTYDLNIRGGNGKTEILRTMGITKIRELPHGTVFPLLRLRTNVPLRCSSIVWSAYDPRDFK